MNVLLKQLFSISLPYWDRSKIAREDKEDLTSYIEVTLHFHGIFVMQDILFWFS